MSKLFIRPVEIRNTNPAGSSQDKTASLSIEGGVSIVKDAFIGGTVHAGNGLDAEGARLAKIGAPVQPEDAVNLDYLQHNADFFSIETDASGKFRLASSGIASPLHGASGDTLGVLVDDASVQIDTGSGELKVNRDLELDRLRLASKSSADPAWGVSTTDENELSIRDPTGLQTISVKDGKTTFIKGISSGGYLITDVADPVEATDACTKGYADALAQGLDIKDSVVAASTTEGTFVTAFAAGQTLDGVVLQLGQRILLKNQDTDPTQNGIFIATSGAPTRPLDMRSGMSIGGAYTFVESGTVNSSCGFVLNGTGGGRRLVVDQDPLRFTQFSGAGLITAGNGLSKTGNTLDVVLDSGSLEFFNDAVRISNATVGTGLSGGSGPKISVNSNLPHVTGLGTITSGAWTASTISVPHGGTGATSWPADTFLVGAGASPLSALTEVTYMRDVKTIVAPGLNATTSIITPVMTLGTRAVSRGSLAVVAVAGSGFTNSAINDLAFRAEGGSIRLGTAAIGTSILDIASEGTIVANVATNAISANNTPVRFVGGIGVGKSIHSGYGISTGWATDYAGGVTGTTGAFLDIRGSTFRNTETAASSRSGDFYTARIAQQTVTSASTSVVTPTAASLYIAGPPIAGTNTVIENPLSISVASGAVRIGDTSSSISKDSGALVVRGGTGVWGDLNLGGSAFIGASAAIGTNLTVSGTSALTGNTSIAGSLTIGVSPGTASTTGVTGLSTIANDTLFSQISINNANVAGSQFNLGVGGSGNAGRSGQLYVWNSGAATYLWQIAQTGLQSFTRTGASGPLGSAQFLTPSLSPAAANANRSEIYFGPILGNYNAGVLNFNYLATGGTNNTIGLGFIGANNLFTLNGTGAVSLGGAPTTISKLAITGTDANVPTGPHIAVYTSADTYPVYHQLNFSHNNVSMNFDTFYDGGAWRSSFAGSSAQIYKMSNALSINYGVGAVNSVVTFNPALSVNLTNGAISIPTALTATGATTLSTLTVTGTEVNLSNAGAARVKLNPTGNIIFIGAVPGDAAGDFHVWDSTGNGRLLGWYRATNTLTLGKADGSTTLSVPGASTFTGGVTLNAATDATATAAALFLAGGLTVSKSLFVGTGSIVKGVSQIARQALIDDLYGDDTVRVYPPIRLTSNTGTQTLSNQLYGNGTYVASHSSTAGLFYAYLGFGDDNANFWSSLGRYNGTTGAYTGSASTIDKAGTSHLGEYIDVCLPQTKQFASVKIYPRKDVPGPAPSTFVIFGSENQTNWTVLYSQATVLTWVNNVPQTFAITDTGLYRWIRIVVKSTVGGAEAGYTQFSFSLSARNPYVHVSSAVDSVSSGTGALQLDGGMGVAKWITVGGGAGSTGLSGTGGLAFEYASSSNGLRHFIRSRHLNVAAVDPGNAIDFYLNSSVAISGSTAPGVGNTLGLSVAASGVTIPGTTGIGKNLNVGTTQNVGTVNLGNGGSATAGIVQTDVNHAMYLRYNVAGAVNKVALYSFGDIEFYNNGLLAAQTLKLSINAAGLVTVPGDLLVQTGLSNVRGVDGGHSLVVRNTANGGSSFANVSIQNELGQGVNLFINSTARTADGGSRSATLRNDAGDLLLQAASGAGLGMRISATTNVVRITTGTASDATTTGALVVTGGVGVGGAINSASVASGSVTAGSLTTSGSVSFTGNTPMISANGGTGPLSIDPNFGSNNYIRLFDDARVWGDFSVYNNSGTAAVFTIAGSSGAVTATGSMGLAGNLTFPNNGNGIVFGAGFSKIFDNANLHVYTDDVMYFDTGSTAALTLTSATAAFSGSIVNGMSALGTDGGLELGLSRTSNGYSYIDLHAVAGTDYETRIMRNGGPDGTLHIAQNGAGQIVLQNSGGVQVTSALTIAGASNAYGKLALTGQAGNISGPHVVVYSSSDTTYPMFQQLNWSHDNISLNFDMYLDGSSWKSSFGSSSAQIYKISNALNINWGVAAAGSTVSFSPALSVNLTNGVVTIGNAALGTTTTGAFTASGVTTINNDLYVGGGHWIRKYGNTGIYWQDHGGGWYMENPTWIMALGDKGISTGGQVRSGSLLVNGNASLASMTVSGNTTVNGEFYSGSNAWIRKQGNNGIHWETWGGGWYMDEPDWVKSYNNKGILTNGQVRSGSLQVNGNATISGTLNITGTVSVPTPVNGTDAASKSYVDGKQSTTTAGTGLVKSGDVISVDPNQSISTLTTSGDATVNGELYSGSGKWIRKYGTTGIYWQDWGGGWYMNDAQWVKSFNNKGISTAGAIEAGSLQVNGNVNSASITTTGNIKSGSLNAGSLTTGDTLRFPPVPLTSNATAVTSGLWKGTYTVSQAVAYGWMDSLYEPYLAFDFDTTAYSGWWTPQTFSTYDGGYQTHNGTTSIGGYAGPRLCIVFPSTMVFNRVTVHHPVWSIGLGYILGATSTSDTNPALLGTISEGVSTISLNYTTAYSTYYLVVNKSVGRGNGMVNVTEMFFNIDGPHVVTTGTLEATSFEGAASVMITGGAKIAKDLRVMGTGYSRGGFLQVSDARHKEDIADLDDDFGLDLIRSLSPKSYRLKRDMLPDNDRRYFGLLGQDVRDNVAQRGLLAFAGVKEEAAGLTMDYSQLIAPLIKAIQEMDRDRSAAKEDVLWLLDTVKRQQECIDLLLRGIRHE